VHIFAAERFSDLQARLAAIRLEKSGLVIEIATSSTTAERKEEAVRRYASLIKQLQACADELGKSLGR
jgi:hypothetical protein